MIMNTKPIWFACIEKILLYSRYSLFDYGGDAGVPRFNSAITTTVDVSAEAVWVKYGSGIARRKQNFFDWKI